MSVVELLEPVPHAAVMSIVLIASVLYPNIGETAIPGILRGGTALGLGVAGFLLSCGALAKRRPSTAPERAFGGCRRWTGWRRRG
jgi:hypothetical protein